MSTTRRKFIGLIGGAGAAAVMPAPLLGLAVEPVAFAVTEGRYIIMVGTGDTYIKNMPMPAGY
jgi:hypothetical protein